MLQTLELAGALVHQSAERDTLDVRTRLRQVEVPRNARVSEDGRHEEDPAPALGPVRRGDSGERILPVPVALVERRPVEHASRAGFHLVEDDVAERVAVQEEDPRVVGRPSRGKGAVGALPQRVRLARLEIDANGEIDRLLA